MSDLSSRDLKFVNLAIKMAQDIEPWAGTRIATILAYRGEILSFGCNDNKSHPFQARFGKNHHAVFWHSETHCISNAIKRNYLELLPKSTMYIMRIMANGMPALSRPCNGCNKAIKHHKINRILYSTGEIVSDIPVMADFISS